ncbi:MAG: DUF2029 domain-containing protein [Hellea sp.]|nr:DUF2029 domain-containing protein [Hellea sp.]
MGRLLENRSIFILVACFAFYAAFSLYFLVQYYGPPFTLVVPGDIHYGRDFINVWGGGNAALEGDARSIFDRELYAQLLFQYAEQKIPLEMLRQHAFSYPPHTLFFLVPFAFVSYIPALVLWTILGIAACWKSFSTYLGGKIALLALLVPSGLVNLVGGQNGFFTAALFIGGFSQLKKNPYLAGILFGILTIKPQLGVLLALALLAARQWKVIFAAGVTCITLMGLSALIFGIELWRTYATVTLPYQSGLLKKSIGIFDHMVPSLYKSLINSGMPADLAIFPQYGLMAICLMLVVWAFLRPRNSVLQLSLLCAVTSLFSPYLAIYDLTLLTFAVFLWMSFHFKKDSLTAPRAVLGALLISLPITHLYFSAAGFYWLPLLISLFAAILVADLRGYEAPSPA